MKKITLIILCLFSTQSIHAQVAQYNVLYLLFEPENTQSNATQSKSIDNQVQNADNTWREEDAYGYAPKWINGILESSGFYNRLYITINRNDFITIPLSQLSTYPVKTIDQVRQEAHPSNKYDFYNEAYYEPILHYYIVEKDTNTNTAKIVKVLPFVIK